MRLIEDWWAVLRHAWTVRIAIFGAMLNGIYVAITIWTESLPVAPIWLAVVNGVLATAVPIVRLIPQKRLRREKP